MLLAVGLTYKMLVSFLICLFYPLSSSQLWSAPTELKWSGIDECAYAYHGACWRASERFITITEYLVPGHSSRSSLLDAGVFCTLQECCVSGLFWTANTLSILCVTTFQFKCLELTQSLVKWHCTNVCACIYRLKLTKTVSSRHLNLISKIQ